ncbi:MAG: gliding motility-associated ABC transporter substrate-binding protein GldG, partial [Paludibacter sp.]|nr:gliding motility-associated ABC transporter substrate-binding protein GldG [Paludibacter sp.]
GDLNTGFLRLKKSAVDLLDEMSVYTKSMNITFENPSLAASNDERLKKYEELQAKGMTPTAVYERDKEGKSIQKIVFPWIQIRYNNKVVYVNLLKNIRGLSGEENLNTSIENLEFEITDGLRRIINDSVIKIAFIEGHGELNEAETYQISKTLSRYFQIDRGILSVDATILKEYKAIIIAKPTKPFSESDKYIIDQYIMNGGRVLWLIDGVKIAPENLAQTGVSPAMELDLNLGDQLFRYGIRINPVLLQDIQCVNIPVNIAPSNAEPQFKPTPWYFAPLLLTSTQHTITKNIAEVKADFCSAIDIVGERANNKATLLLATSDNSHIIGTPSTIDLSEMQQPQDKKYFNSSFIPVAVLLEGEFESVFSNRKTPQQIVSAFPFKEKVLDSRQIFVADGDIIRNETSGVASDSTTLPLGYDRYMNQQFGNSEFIKNAVLYLADEDEWLQLRSKTMKLRLLNKKLVNDQKAFWQIINVVLPIMLLICFGMVYQWVRKRKNTR